MKKTALFMRPEKRGLTREEASAYIGVGVTKFDELVATGQMPVPKRIGSRRIWDRYQLDEYFSAIEDSETTPNTWGDVV